MSDLADLFSGFASKWIDTAAGRMFARTGGEGPPGRTTDLTHDEQSRAAGAKITCPMLAIWGSAGGIPAETAGPLATWREWATDVRGFAIDCGHYLAEEAPDATAKALIEFFATS
jgi:haloacetate dehalogenase